MRSSISAANPSIALRRWARLAPLLVLVLVGCAAQIEHGRGLDLLAEGKLAEGVESLRRANTMEPDNVRYRVDYLNQRGSAIQGIVAAADDDRLAGRLDAAGLRLREAARIEPGNDRVKAGLAVIDRERRVAQQLQNLDRLILTRQTDQAGELLRVALRESPQHAGLLGIKQMLDERSAAEREAREEQLAARAAFKRPVTLQFRDTPLRLVFEALARTGNINVIVDRDVKSDLRTTIFVKEASIEDTLDVILLQNQLERRILNSNTLLIYPASPAKQKELAELKIRTFVLSNVDATFMANIIKTMLKTKDLVTDIKTNTLVMRDTVEAVALAERLVAANDLPDAEVMLEVEVLEISSSLASDIGLKLPTSFSLGTPAAAADGSALTLGALRRLSANDLLTTPLTATLNLLLQDGETNILASPRIRTRNKEKAHILVGDKLPIITNIISPQAAGQNSVITGTIQYVDVGIKLEVEPQVYADGDVGIKLNLEVSNVSDTILTQSGRAYQIGTRSAQTVLRLHDGETQVMAGLINNNERKAAQRVPGIGQLPVLGRLFSDSNANKTKSEIVLSITPHIIRPQPKPSPAHADAWSGSDSSLRDHQIRLDPVSIIKAAQPKAGTVQAISLPAALLDTAPSAAEVSAAPAAPVSALVQARPLPGRAVLTAVQPTEAAAGGKP